MLKSSLAFVLLCALLLAVSPAECKRKGVRRKSKSVSSINGVQSGLLNKITSKQNNFELLHNNEVHGVVQVREDTWKWKTRSHPMKVKDDVIKAFLKDINNTFSLSLETRSHTKQISSLFHAYSNFNNVNMTWIQILLDTSNKVVVVQYRTTSLTLHESRFDLPSPSHKTWIKLSVFFVKDVSAGNSTVSFQSSCDQPQLTQLAEVINLVLPRDLIIEIGGNSIRPDTAFTGLIRNAILHRSGSSPYLQPCDRKRDSENDGISAQSHHRKRGAPDKHNEGSRKKKIPSRRDVTKNSNIDPDDSFDSIVDELRLELQSCREENKKVNNMLQIMKQAQSSLESRISVLETCECIPMCISGNGVKRRHGEVWETEGCTSCHCTNGETQCRKHENCASEVHACLSNPCLNNGECEKADGDTASTFRCRCRRGFYGNLCQYTDKCEYGVCQNGANCELTPDGAYLCHCQDGFTGRNCDQTEDHCLSSPCGNGGYCNSNPTGFTCNCLIGFSGEYCEDTDGCTHRPCQNGGVCTVSPLTGYTCRCRQGFYGGNCEHQDACYSSPCLNRGRCQQMPALNGEEPEPPGYSCICSESFYGHNCEYRDACYSSPCLNEGRCLRSPTLNGEESDLPGYSCICPESYYGHNCEHMDVCNSNPCLNRGQCLLDSLNNGRYTCTCPQSYHGPRCEFHDSCYSNPCLNGGRCTSDSENEILTYICACPPSFSGDRCEHEDVCFSSPCLNGGQCLPLSESEADSRVRYTCRCPDTNFGQLCEHRNPCFDNPCKNGGFCEALPSGGFNCRCRLTHYGDRCELTNYCRGSPCMNGGTCLNEQSDDDQPYTCRCRNGYIGERCEYEDLCRRNLCLNGGTCHMEDGDYNCDCPNSYFGTRCELVDFCAKNPCSNGGRCENIPSGDGYRCTCPDTHTGPNCKQPHPCRPNPCFNQGHCRIIENTGYECVCPPSHYGPNCRLIHYCRTNPCLNGGTCMNNRRGFVCTCTDGFSGRTCDRSLLCASNPCKNGATCIENDGSFICICPQTHQGQTCQYPCNVCAYDKVIGDCDGSSGKPVERWYFNKRKQTCEQFKYSGCRGNGNNFKTRLACKQRCLVGSCCMLRLSSVEINGHATEVSSAYSCRSLSIGQCKRMNYQHRQIQVLSFKPGVACEDSQCSDSTTCSFNGREYSINERIDVGCRHSCVCRKGGYLDCRCDAKFIRREIRRLTSSELLTYQAAVRSLKNIEIESGRNVWDILRDEYFKNSPGIQSARYFLLWNRAVLKKMEMTLQKVNCRVTIPYFDFTLDAGRFKESVAWQPNYFGGDGDCVPDHPFRVIENGVMTQWIPCLTRKFNLTAPIPNMVDMAETLNSRTYEELSARLQGLVSYVNAFVGGDMVLTTRAYDPLFYSIHAYIDYIFMLWQERHPGRSELQHVQGVENISFGISMDDLWDSACVEYASASYLLPCNRSDLSEELFATDGYNLQGYNRQGFDRDGFDKSGYNTLGTDRYGRPDRRGLYRYDGYNAEGYDRSGYDRHGYDRFGFDRDGWNRDGFNCEGYDRSGYNRYGLNELGFDRRGFNMYGQNKYGTLDSSEFYDTETGYNDCCFGRDGITPSGLDKFGFNVEGYDSRNCEYYFNGPHSLHYREKLWKMISVQSSTFLTTISRPCGSLGSLSKSIYSLNWDNAPRYFLGLSTRTPAGRQTGTTSPNKEFIDRFCFDADMLLTWCPCLEDNYPAICSSNPCANVHCDLHRNAKCVVNMCGRSCTAEFYLEGRRVNCENPCYPNPCQNGGTCESARLSSASERFQCRCSEEFMGFLCEKPTPDTCMLSLSVGDCKVSVRRWYYNFMSGACTEFLYSGCGGNSNNFPSKKACDLRCALGACCYRLPKNKTFLVGFDREGYDKYGFNAFGFNRRGQHRSAHDSMPTGNRIHPPKGFGPDGYDIYGYNEEGYDRQGYDRNGYHRDSGYNRTGFNPSGEFDQLMEYGYDGYNSSGLDRSGYTCNGIDREGFNQLGLYYDFEYLCESLLLSECEALKDPGQLEIPFEVVSFTPGKTCDEVKCEDECGCKVNGNTYHFGETFQHGCQTCRCTLGGVVDCSCQQLGKRKEIRDLSADEFAEYVAAVKSLHHSETWEYMATLHAQHMPQAHGRTLSLPWHRHFLQTIEKEMQKLHSNCDVFIPYFDWTIDAGDLKNSQIWQASMFGGDGEPGSQCVRYHPFSNDVLWHPCIRREFNESISLPDAVDFNILLHTTDYESFRLQLEMMSSLFHLWVGGHMASPFSPYDPIFLTHWAFIDHVWDEWQKRNPMGVSRFPVEQRYVPLTPFDVTPDNVLSSQEQSCIIYIPPTLGPMCNVSTLAQWPLGVWDEQGLDRHGFDAQGFDVNGFNVDGLDRSGQPDTRNMYDRDGFDSQGYHRTGFDKLEWDKYNYNKFDFNRDGFDVEGFDSSGYNRYGFDRDGKTSFGLFKNGSFAIGYDRGYAASLFDSYGYNRYGYDRYGYDHKGYDVFGFDRSGLDRDKCNFYQNGPHYTRYFYFAQKQLSMMNLQSLQNIKRICSAITPLPEAWVLQTWLGKVTLIRELEKSWADKHKVDISWKPRASSVTEELLWLPITPDQQFCFDLDWYSGCPLGTKLVECSRDLCVQSTCASQPHAQCRMKNCGACYPEFYDGTTGEVFQCYGCISKSEKIHNEGSTWHEGCNICVCQAGLITCSPMPCPALTCSHPAPDSNQCCETCNDCEYNDQVYRNGQGFTPNSCESCKCMDGSVTCQAQITICPQVKCQNHVTMPGECCPSCPTDCHGHLEGETWIMDKCHNCSCIRSKMVCSANPCPVLSCEYPRTLAGECCPECKGCIYEGRKLRNLQNFMKDLCTQCSCRFGNVMCTTQQCPPLSCIHKETPPGSCCQRCRKGCEYEGTFFDDNKSFQPQNNPCLNCTCQDDQAQCLRINCPQVFCARPIIRPGQCCPECSSCRDRNNMYREGQMWTSSDGCQKCLCQQGKKKCRDINPCSDVCTHGVRLYGQCCQDCSQCSYHRKTFLHLEPFTDPEDVCRRCSCQSGNVICFDIICPEVQCSRKEMLRGQCCARCKSCIYNGEQKEHGSSWRLPGNPCTTCSCQEGNVECIDERCPPIRCDYPAITVDSCCPRCYDCLYHGNQYRNGERVRAGDVCSTCQCRSGNVICGENPCPEVNCDSPVLKPGECCPSCTTCNYDGQVFSDESTFIAPRNSCLQCKCKGGNVECQRLDLNCPRTLCPNPGRSYSQCCPTCDFCEYERRNYENGTDFHPTGSTACLRCSCLAGTVRCRTETCKPLSCPNPVTSLGKCCPECEECVVDGQTYTNGEKWQADACTICQCLSGHTECNQVRCPEVSCSHPAKIGNQCCFTCDHCTYNGHIYSDGRKIPNSSDTCSICTCRAGNVECIPRRCPKLECSNAIKLQGSCCPTCPSHCEFLGVTIANGKKIKHPVDKCKDCLCTDGTVKCSRRECIIAPCHDPASDGCCRNQCNDCRYHGRQLKNGQTVKNRDPCKSCTCTDGNVICLRESCPHLTCENPNRVPGECCPVCPNPPARCLHNGHVVAHSEQFKDNCRACRCNNGEVTCQPVRCPTVSCSYPVRIGCCLSCDGCRVKETDYANGHEVSDFNSSGCETCHCNVGEVICSPKECLSVLCLHARTDGCCPSCDGCTYNKISYNNGVTFPVPDKPCDICLCKDGEVSCSRKSCDQSQCTHPLLPEQSECCPKCGGDCLFEGRVYTQSSGMFTLSDDVDKCQVCVCNAGSVICKRKPCPIAKCKHPVLSKCGCPTCNDCMYNGVLRHSRETFPNPENEKCSECYCSTGNVVCGNKPCQSPPCTHPATDDCNCPTCNRCLYFGRIHESGDTFPDLKARCNQCQCQDGSVKCSSKVCSQVTCANPITDTCGCPSCEGCNYAGIDHDEGDRFEDVTNRCTECVCASGTVTCDQVKCQPITCPNPVMSPSECCPRCIGMCHSNGKSYENGATFTMLSDPCSICTCSAGEILCVRQRCQVRCTNPIAQSQCCPDCSACLYMGVRYQEGDVLVPRDNACKQCTCYRGNIICSDKKCPVPECENPLPVRGRCCPQCPQAWSNECIVNGKQQELDAKWKQNENGICQECQCRESGTVSCTSVTCNLQCTHPVPSIDKCCSECGSCFYGNQTFQNGHMFHPSRCQDCMCEDGNVKCVTRPCQPLSCSRHKQIKKPGDCCPQCISCTLDGKAYSDGQIWSVSGDPCTECYCLNGVVTCGQVQCIKTCQMTVSVPGQCCPVCANCFFNKQLYAIGDSFEPNSMDPCEICECQASPTGAAILCCKRKQCPSLADCPRSCIQQPRPGSCCPTCTNRPECRYGLCQSSLLGQQIIPSDNNCFSCDCNPESTWLCKRGTCKTLSCPISKRYTPKGSCCPVCNECHLEMENIDIPSGKVWQRNECEICQCDKGTIMCRRESCPPLPLVCEPGMLAHKQPGQCCEECLNVDAPCVYEGLTVAAHQKWKTDECTTCTCFAGKVKCVTQRCRMLMCTSDEAPTAISGECCPKCLPHSASCVAYGDPHYRTFDGRMIHFQGTCQYLLTADCSKKDFRIFVQNSHNGIPNGRVSWTEQVTVITKGGSIAMMRDYTVRVNGTLVTRLPPSFQPYFNMAIVGDYLLLSTHIGVHIAWNGRQRHLEVTVPGTYKRRTCGLCGNFNNYPQDDTRLHNSRLTSSDAEFGNDWKATMPNSPPCPNAEDSNPCDAVNYALRKRANEKCKILRSQIFAACHSLVNPEMYFATCVYDSCACGENDPSCLCDVLEAYAARCRRSGVVIQWRSQSLCAIICPAERGYVFDECGSPCKRTCANRNLPPGTIAEQCYLPCVSGCQCPAGMVEHERRCILPEHCPENLFSTADEGMGYNQHEL